MKKSFKAVLTASLCICLAVPLAACGPKGPETIAGQQEVYESYLRFAEKAGQEPLDYEEWLASIKGAAGQNGQDGTAGADGEDGVDGATWMASTGAPAASIGKTNDLYLDTANGDVYQKSATAWEKICNVKGLKGDKGDKGDTGEDGTDGVGIESITQEFDKWGIMMTTVYHMSDGSEKRMDPVDLGTKYEKVYEANDNTELEFLLSKKATNIRLTADVKRDNPLQLSGIVNLDLGGYTLSNVATYGVASTILAVGKASKIKIANGKITRKGPENSARAVELQLGAAVQLADVDITSNGYGIIVTGNSHLSISDSKVTAKWHAISTNNMEAGTYIDVKGSTFTSTDDVSIFLSSYMVAEFYDCTLQGLTGMQIMMGDITVKDCTIKATSTTYTPYTVVNVASSSGTLEKNGAAILLRCNYYYDKSAKTNELKLNLSGNVYEVANTSKIAFDLYDVGYVGGGFTTADPDTISDQFSVAYDYFSKLDIPGLHAMKAQVYSEGVLNEVEKVKDYTETMAALNSGKSVHLTADFETTTPISFAKNGNYFVYGGGHKVTNTSASQNPWVFDISDNPDTQLNLDGIRVKLSHIDMEAKSGTYSRGVNVRVAKDAKVFLDHCNIDVSYYAINIRGGVENLTLRVKNCERISGWSALNCYANNSNLYFEDSKLIGINDKSQSPSNDYSTVVFDGGNIDNPSDVGKLGSNNIVTAKNCEIATVVEEVAGTNQQTHLALQYGALNNTISCYGCSFYTNHLPGAPTFYGENILENNTITIG